MRSLLVKSGVIAILALVMGSGLTLASAPSKPGMFLYPVKQTAQKITGAFTNGPGTTTPIIIVTQDAVQGKSDLSHDDPSADNEDDTTEQPDLAAPPQTQEPTVAVPSATKGPAAAPVPPKEEATTAPDSAPARAVDEINLIAQPGGSPSANAGEFHGPSSAPDNGQPDGSTHAGDATDNSASHDESQDGIANDHSFPGTPDNHADDSHSEDDANHAPQPSDHEGETHADTSSQRDGQDSSSHDD
jgi:hypothetical protein